MKKKKKKWGKGNRKRKEKRFGGEGPDSTVLALVRSLLPTLYHGGWNHSGRAHIVRQEARVGDRSCSFSFLFLYFLKFILMLANWVTGELVNPI
jgi:hypothetical protein